MLYTRRLTVAVVSAGSLASSSLTFTQTPVFSDPYVFAVPRGLDLSRVTDPDSELDPDDRRLLNSVVQFTFGSTYQLRIAGWYQTFFRPITSSVTSAPTNWLWRWSRPTRCDDCSGPECTGECRNRL